jgi:hypothetical protein
LKEFKIDLREIAIAKTAEDYSTHCDLLDAYEPSYDSKGNWKQDALDNIIYRLAKNEYVEERTENRLMFTFINLYRCKSEEDVLEIIKISKGKILKLETIKRYRREITNMIKEKISPDIKSKILNKIRDNNGEK